MGFNSSVSFHPEKSSGGFPYTAPEDIKTTFLTPFFLACSKILMVPKTLFFSNFSGLFQDSETEVEAAR